MPSSSMKQAANLLAFVALLLGQRYGTAVELHHHDYKQMLKAMEEVHGKCPEITEIYNLEGHPDHTLQGRKLAVLVLSDNPSDHEPGRACEVLHVHVFPFSYSPTMDFQSMIDPCQVAHST